MHRVPRVPRVPSMLDHRQEDVLRMADFEDLHRGQADRRLVLVVHPPWDRGPSVPHLMAREGGRHPMVKVKDPLLAVQGVGQGPTGRAADFHLTAREAGRVPMDQEDVPVLTAMVFARHPTGQGHPGDDRLRMVLEAGLRQTVLECGLHPTALGAGEHQTPRRIKHRIQMLYLRIQPLFGQA